MPRSPAERTARRIASTPRRCPSKRGRPRWAAQRPLPSMMIATCVGTPSPAGGQARSGADSFASPLMIALSMRALRLDLHDFLFLRDEQRVHIGDELSGSLLHLIGVTLAVVLADGAVLLELLQQIEPVPANMAHRDLGL